MVVEMESKFERLEGGFALSKDSFVKEKLMQWNLADALKVERFRVKRKITSENEEEIVKDFFRDENAKDVLKLGGSNGNEVQRLKDVVCCKLQTQVTSMSFFDKLADAGIVSHSTGVLQRCLDETYDGSTVSDLLKEYFVNPESETQELFDEDEQKEFIFHLLRALVVGGPLCQSDESFEPYNEVTRLLYKDLLTVRKNATDKQKIDITSSVYKVDGSTVFQSPTSRFHTCFVILDARKRWITVWHHQFKPFW